MNLKNQHIVLGLGLLLGASSLACSSKSDTPPPASGSGGSATGGSAGAPGAGGAGGSEDNTPPPPTGSVSKTPGTCANSTISILFSPMYSAFDGTHTFQVPAIVDGVASDSVVWSASDLSFVGIQSDPTTGGILMTTLKAGQVDIIATSGTACGVAKLNIAQAESDDWAAGDARYNNGVVLARANRGNRDGGAGNGDGGGRNNGDGGRNNGDGGGRDGGGTGLGGVADGGDVTRLACTNCHGPTANSEYKTVSHTPQQTAGFSDDQLKMIFEGVWPSSGNAFDASITSMEQWSRFHKWNMTEDEAAGVIIYLRALTPAKQTGSRNFGGRGRGNRDGGMRSTQDAAAPSN